MELEQRAQPSISSLTCPSSSPSRGKKLACCLAAPSSPRPAQQSIASSERRSVLIPCLVGFHHSAYSSSPRFLLYYSRSLPSSRHDQFTASCHDFLSSTQARMPRSRTRTSAFVFSGSLNHSVMLSFPFSVSNSQSLLSCLATQMAPLSQLSFCSCQSFITIIYPFNRSYYNCATRDGFSNGI